MSRFERVWRRISGSIWQLIIFIPQYVALKRLSRDKVRFALLLSDAKPCLADATSTTGFDRHYVLHIAWATRILAKSMPNIHTDISSSLYFIASVSAFVSVKFLDYRPANLGLSGVSEGSVDLSNLPYSNDSISSISCMHVVEHIGLGRYGDSIDYEGDIRATSELERVLSFDGQLLFVVPIASKPSIKFNAHRIYSVPQVKAMFSKLVLDEFSLIPDDPADGGLVPWPSDELIARQNYACGCFLFRKVKQSSSEKKLSI